MRQNELLVADRLLTGYSPNAEGLSAIAELVEELKRTRPNLVYLLDPVLGDSGRLYVSPDVIPIYKSMLPHASIITPNWFEVETLTDIQLVDLSSLRQAFHILHTTYHVPNVVMSSIPLKSWLADALPASIRPYSAEDDANAEYLICIASSATPGNNSAEQVSAVYAQCVPAIPGYFSGVGDLFSALVLGHYYPSTPTTSSSEQLPLAYAASHALTTTHEVLRRSHESALLLPEEERQPSDDELDRLNPLRKTRRMRGRELRLIQSQDFIRGTDKVQLRRMEAWEGFWTV
ncbi:hypothetical protein HGRIS_005196 [Hohenbuehelia grisea]